MSWIKAAQFPINKDLRHLDRRLTESSVPHRIVEEGGEQVLWLANTTDVTQLEQIIESLQESRTDAAAAQAEPAFMLDKNRIIATLFRFPFTCFTLVLGFLGFLIVEFYSGSSLYRGMIFLPLDSLYENNQYWRLLTPVYLHFGVMHILFNGLFIWELGRRLEAYCGSVRLAVLFMALAVLPNYIQFMSAKSIFFGGLSGVVFGYGGFLFMLSRRTAHPVLQIPLGFYLMLLISLFLGLFKLTDILMGVSVANGAHLGGLFVGMLIGWLYRPKQKQVEML